MESYNVLGEDATEILGKSFSSKLESKIWSSKSQKCLLKFNYLDFKTHKAPYLKI